MVQTVNYSSIDKITSDENDQVGCIILDIANHASIHVNETSIPSIIASPELPPQYNFKDNIIQFQGDEKSNLSLDDYPVLGNLTGHFLRSYKAGNIGHEASSFEESFDNAYFQNFFGKIGEYIMGEHVVESRPFIKRVTAESLEHDMRSIENLISRFERHGPENKKDVGIELGLEYSHTFPLLMAQELCESLDHPLTKDISNGKTFASELYNLSNKDVYEEYFFAHAKDHYKDIINLGRELDSLSN